jgi:hypothetical protein
MIKFGHEITDAVIIGGDFNQAALFYNGRKQGHDLYGDTDSEIIGKAKALRQELLEQCGTVASRIYPDNSQWELRIY